MINQAGKYNVTIRGPRWEMMPEKDGDANRMKLVLPGETSSGEAISGDLLFISTIIGSGKFAGTSVFAKSAEQCIDLGMDKPFNPAGIDKLEGVEVEFVVEMEEYEGKTYPRVKFINSIYGDPIDASKASDIWAKLSGREAPAAAPRCTVVDPEVLPDMAPTTEAGSSDLPF